MQNSKLYCFGIHDDVLSSIQSLNYIPVGLGENTISSGWLKDNTGDQIASKNKYYSELTFYYWLWKNKFKEIPNNIWVGFSQYRRHWKQNKDQLKVGYKLENEILKKIPFEWKNYETILPNPIDIQGQGFGSLAKNEGWLFDKSNLEYHIEKTSKMDLANKLISQIVSINN